MSDALRLKSLGVRIKLLIAALLVAAVLVAAAASSGTTQVGPIQIGAATAQAACGTWYRYYTPDRILSYSDACNTYFANNGWHGYAGSCDTTGHCAWLWLTRD